MLTGRNVSLTCLLSIELEYHFLVSIKLTSLIKAPITQHEIENAEGSAYTLNF